MSHIATVELEIKSLSALGAAIEALGGQLHLDQKKYQSYYDQKACDAVITHPEAKYSVGVIAQEDGTYRLAFDSWSTGGLVKVFGKALAGIKQRYASVVARQKMQQSGFRVQETQQQDGTLQLVCTR